MPIQRSNEPDAFTLFEQEGWSNVIEPYQRLLGPLTSQTIDATLDAAAVADRDRVLDICTGHGILAAAAAKRGAAARGLDFSAEVLAVARRNAPEIRFDQGDAQCLPYADDSFDKVVCGYGIIHVPEPDRALAEMYRVVRPGGRVALSVWARAAPGNGFGVLFGAIKTHGRLDVPLPHGPDFFQFSDEESISAALAETGFRDVKARVVRQDWRLERAGDLVPAIMEGSVRARALLRGQEPRDLAEIKAAVEEGLAPFAARGGEYRVPMPAIVGNGAKPG
jgi:SAM-dependent methyltransferase